MLTMALVKTISSISTVINSSYMHTEYVRKLFRWHLSYAAADAFGGT